MTDKYLHFNNFAATLVNPISNVATSAELDNVAALIDPEWQEYYFLTLFDSTTGDLETVKVSNLAGSVITIARNQEGTVGPAGGWPAGATIEHRLTATALNNGANERLSKSSELPGWIADTYADHGHVVLTSGGKIMVCIQAGVSGPTEPTTTGYVKDYRCYWYAVSDNYTAQDVLELGLGAKAIGQNCAAYGDLSMALRYRATAGGHGARATSSGLGMGDNALGMDSGAAVGPYTVAGDYGFAGAFQARSFNFGLSIGYQAGGSDNRTRRSNGQILLGREAYGGAEFGINMVGHCTIPPFVGSYASGKSNDLNTAKQSASEVVITSVPVNLGDGPVWQADTLYEHGTVIFPTVPNGYCYVAYCQDYYAKDEYFAAKTSGPIEPTWAAQVSDPDVNGVKWYAVNPASMLLELGDYSRFTPTEVGFVCDENASPVTQPIISFGIDTDAAKWLAGIQTTMLTGALSNHMFAPTNNEGSKTLKAAMVTAGTGNITGRFVLKGLMLETMTV
jgi:hypothetical protein